MADLESLHRSSGDYRIVYQIEMGHQVQIRAGGYEGDDHVVGYDRRRKLWHVIATSQKLAEAAWQKEFGWDASNTLVSCEALITIDAEISVRRGWPA